MYVSEEFEEMEEILAGYAADDEYAKRMQSLLTTIKTEYYKMMQTVLKYLNKATGEVKQK